MSVSYGVFGVNVNEAEKKKKAKESIAFMESNNIGVPDELYDIVERENISLKDCTEQIRGDYYTEFVVDVAKVPKDVDTVVFRIS